MQDEDTFQIGFHGLGYLIGLVECQNLQDNNSLRDKNQRKIRDCSIPPGRVCLQQSSASNLL